MGNWISCLVTLMMFGPASFAFICGGVDGNGEYFPPFNYNDIMNDRTAFNDDLFYYPSWNMDHMGDSFSSRFSFDLWGTIYVRRTDNRIMAIEGNGSVRWEHVSDAKHITDPTISASGGIIYVTGTGEVRHLTPSGNLGWKLGIDPSPVLVTRPALLSNGSIVCATFREAPNGTLSIFIIGSEGDLKRTVRFNSYFPAEALLVGPNDELVLYGSNHVMCLGKDLEVLWEKDTSERIGALTLDVLSRTHLTMRDGSIVCLTRDGNVSWERGEPLSKGMVPEAIVTDRVGALIVVHRYYVQGMGRSIVEKFDIDGEWLWKADCPYVSMRPSIDAVGNILIGGLGGLMVFDSGGNVIWEGLVDEFTYRNEIVLMDERTIVSTDLGRIECYRGAPFKFSISTSQPFGRVVVTEVNIERVSDSLSLPIKEIVLIETDSFHENPVEIRLGPDDRRYFDRDPPESNYYLQPVIVLKNGERLYGETIYVFAEDNTEDYLWVCGGICCPLTLLAVAITLAVIVVRARRRKRRAVSGG